jgi:hypothetical protein
MCVTGGHARRRVALGAFLYRIDRTHTVPRITPQKLTVPRTFAHFSGSFYGGGGCHTSLVWDLMMRIACSTDRHRVTHDEGIYIYGV